nr:hypothetical protein [Candidatus Anoxychlamydiales bacterium]
MASFSNQFDFCIRQSSCSHVLGDRGSERDSPIDYDLVERARSCMFQLSSIEGTPYSLEKKDFVEIEAVEKLKSLAAYKRLLELNGHPSDFESYTNPMSIFELNSRKLITPTNTTSSASKLSPRIDILRLYPLREKINDGWIQDCINFTDFTPLHIAVFKKDEKAIEEILSHISKNELIQKRDANNLTALHWAVILGDSKTLKVILNQIKPEDRLSTLNMQDNRGWSVFKWVIANQNEGLIHTIFSSLEDVDKALLVTGIDQYKRSYIHYAIETGNNKIVELLLDQIFFENDKSNLALFEDFSGQTLLHLGVNILDAETFEVLLEKMLPNKFIRSIALQKVDNLNQTPL